MSKIKFNILLLICLSVISTSCKSTKKVSSTAEETAAATDSGIFAEIETSKGKIIVQLEYQKTPITVANFISLAEGTNTFVTDIKLKGKHFYDGLKFHRVIANFMIQGGDPQGTGAGGPGYVFKDEITDAKFDKAGILAMANSGPNTNGSQLFITHKDTPWLTGKHTIFGYVIQGQDIVNTIKQDDLIDTIKIIRKGRDAEKFNAVKVFSKYMKKTADDEKGKVTDKKKKTDLAVKKERTYKRKYSKVIAKKAKYFKETKAQATETASGFRYQLLKAGTGEKSEDGSTVYINYSGYFEDGSLFDSSVESVMKEYGKFDENKAGGYHAFPFEYGKKSGLIPGFIEALSMMKVGDKLLAFIPAKLGYGGNGAGTMIPPNADLIFEIELKKEL